MVSGFVTSPDDQSRIILLDASPIRIASKSLMSIKLRYSLSLLPKTEFQPAQTPRPSAAPLHAPIQIALDRSLVLFQFNVCEICRRRRFSFGRRPFSFRDVHLVEIAERLVVRERHLTVLVHSFLSLFGLFGRRLPCCRAERAGREVDAELLGCAEELVVFLAHLDGRSLVGLDPHVQRERLHLLQQHLEALRDGRLRDVLALDDRLVRLHASDGVVGLDREHLLQRVGGAVGLERPHLHLTEALAAELRLAAERLLRDERVRAGRARVDLVVHEVEQLQDVHEADRHLLLERLTGLPVEEAHLAGALAPHGPLLVDEELHRRIRVLAHPADERLVHVLLGRTVEHRRRDAVRIVGDDRLAGEAVRAVAVLEDAVRCSPAEVRLEDLADVHAARDAERVEHDVDRAAVLEERHVLLGNDARDHALVAVAAGELVALRDLALLRDVDANELVDAGRQVVPGLAGERLDVDDDAALAVRNLERGVADLARLLLEDRADQLLLGGQLGLALRRDLADQQVAGADFGPDPHDAALVEVAQRLLRAVRDVARDLLVAELRRARVDLVLVDVDRGQDVLLHEPLRDDDRVLEVEALERHEGDEQVRAERELALVGRAAVGEHLARLYLVTEADDRLLVDQRALVRAHELRQVVLVARAAALGDDMLRGAVADSAGL